MVVLRPSVTAAPSDLPYPAPSLGPARLPSSAAGLAAAVDERGLRLGEPGGCIARCLARRLALGVEAAREQHPRSGLEGRIRVRVEHAGGDSRADGGAGTGAREALVRYAG